MWNNKIALNRILVFVFLVIVCVCYDDIPPGVIDFLGEVLSGKYFFRLLFFGPILISAMYLYVVLFKKYNHKTIMINQNNVVDIMFSGITNGLVLQSSYAVMTFVFLHYFKGQRQFIDDTYLDKHVLLVGMSILFTKYFLDTKSMASKAFFNTLHASEVES